jgi:hypothetical protein
MRFEILIGLRFLDFDGRGLKRVDVGELALKEEGERGCKMMRGAGRHCFCNVVLLDRYS